MKWGVNMGSFKDELNKAVEEAKEILGSKTTEDIKSSTKEAVDEAKEIVDNLEQKGVKDKFSFLSWRGRLNRVSYFIQTTSSYIIFISYIYIIIYLYKTNNLINADAFLWAAIMFFSYLSFAITSRRFHDVGKSCICSIGLIFSLWIVAFILIKKSYSPYWFLIYILFTVVAMTLKPGNSGENKYGAPDKGFRVGKYFISEEKILKNAKVVNFINNVKCILNFINNKKVVIFIILLLITTLLSYLIGNNYNGINLIALFAILTFIFATMCLYSLIKYAYFSKEKSKKFYFLRIVVSVLLLCFLTLIFIFTRTNGYKLYNLTAHDLRGEWQSRGFFKPNENQTVIIRERVTEGGKAWDEFEKLREMERVIQRIQENEILSLEEEREIRDRARRTLYLNEMEILPYNFNLEQFISEHGVNLRFGDLEPQLWTFYFLGDKAVLSRGSFLLYKNEYRETESVSNVHLGSELKEVLKNNEFKDMKPLDMYGGKKVINSKDKNIGVFCVDDLVWQIYLYPNSNAVLDKSGISVNDSKLWLMLKLGFPETREFENVIVDSYVLHEREESEILHVIKNKSTGEQSMLISQGGFFEPWLVYYDDKIEDLFLKPLGYRLGSKYEDIKNDFKLIGTNVGNGERSYICINEKNLNYSTLVPVDKVKVLGNVFKFNKSGYLYEINIRIDGSKEDIANYLLNSYGVCSSINKNNDDVEMSWVSDENVITYTHFDRRRIKGAVSNSIKITKQFQKDEIINQSKNYAFDDDLPTYALGINWEDSSAYINNLQFVVRGDNGDKVYRASNIKMFNLSDLMPENISVIDNKFIFKKNSGKLIEVELSLNATDFGKVNNYLSKKYGEAPKGEASKERYFSEWRINKLVLQLISYKGGNSNTYLRCIDRETFEQRP